MSGKLFLIMGGISDTLEVNNTTKHYEVWNSTICHRRPLLKTASNQRPPKSNSSESVNKKQLLCCNIIVKRNKSMPVVNRLFSKTARQSKNMFLAGHVKVILYAANAAAANAVDCAVQSKVLFFLCKFGSKIRITFLGCCLAYPVLFWVPQLIATYIPK